MLFPPDEILSLFRRLIAEQLEVFQWYLRAFGVRPQRLPNQHIGIRFRSRLAAEALIQRGDVIGIAVGVERLGDVGGFATDREGGTRGPSGKGQHCQEQDQNAKRNPETAATHGGPYLGGASAAAGSRPMT